MLLLLGHPDFVWVVSVLVILDATARMGILWLIEGLASKTLLMRLFVQADGSEAIVYA